MQSNMEQPSHYPFIMVPVPVPAGYAGGYSATSGAGRIAKFESGIYIHRYKELLLLACYVIASLECRLNTM